jgi:hypothetical protein
MQDGQVQESPTQSSPPESAQSPARSNRRIRDMAFSLIVLLIPIVIVVSLFRLRGGEDVVVVDTAPAIAQARAANAFPVVAPAGLSKEWRPVSAAFQGPDGAAVLRLGYLTPSGGAVQIVESDQDAESLLPRELGAEIRPLGTEAVAGRDWQWYGARGNELALVVTDRDRTVIVVGQADRAELRRLAESLG